MDLFGTFIVFVIAWWLVLFMVLPWGAAPPEKVELGHATSAPAKPRLALKFLITTVIAILLTALVWWIAQSGLVTLRPDQ